jgi:hypothetical protein
MNLWPVNGAASKPRAESNLSNSRGSANNRARRPAERFPGIVRKRADEGSACMEAKRNTYGRRPQSNPWFTSSEEGPDDLFAIWKRTRNRCP